MIVITYGAVALGGALGALFRFILNDAIPHIPMPIQIMLINVMGCLCMGLFAEYKGLFGVPSRAHAFLCARIFSSY